MSREEKSTLTSRFADFAAITTYEQLPADVVAVAKKCFLDNVGVALAGSQEPSVRLMLEVLKTHGGSGGTTVIGSSERLAPLDAALVNAQAAHVLDYDDTQPSGGGHLSASTVCPILTFGRMRHCSGR
jgi:2-methylcitrate dehydratase PrpD